MKITLDNGETLAYEVRQGGTCNLVLLHGNMAASDQWDLLMEHLDPRYTVYAVDLRGYGKSTYNNPIQSIKDFSKDLKLFTDELGLKSFHLMGWSNGGGVAMQFAADYPDRVEKLILLASMSTRGYPIYDPDGERVQTKEQIVLDTGLNMMLEAQRKKNKQFFKTAMDQILYSRNQPEENRYEKYLENAMEQRNILDVADAANRFNISRVSNGVVDGNGEIGRIKAPTLVLWGKEDLITSEQMTHEILNDMKDHGIEVTLSILPAGHSMFIDDLEGVLREVDQFLSSGNE
ncbi:alpha/beta fold hydrolase [Bacillus sp. Marseille-Q3570]|uniref:intracellular short-chain-length polyhydroxyalkanoate depolymerase n=1 Tax=Bacillus sp. Marseille-Q3570 TaxID=2963522 RepID=UPI0021B6E896|nr:alpha/beta hydrolase [Bacillus sp. Marseille-Q3570]